MHTYEVAVRYKDASSRKWHWFMGEQLAHNKAEAKSFALDAFAAEQIPGGEVIATFVTRKR